MEHDLGIQLIRLANEFGADPEFTRIGGGNASVKIGDVLYIKPSGTSLADLTEHDLVPLRLGPLLEALSDDHDAVGDPVMAAAEKARIGPAGGRRPSVEILFHALIPDPLVLHLHPLTANAVTCNEHGRELTKSLLGDQAVWVDYIDPGVPLARGIAAARLDFEGRAGQRAPAIAMLGNHGIIVSGYSYEAVSKRVTQLTSIIRAAIESVAEVDVDVAPVPDARTLMNLGHQFRRAIHAASVVWDADSFIAQTAVISAAPVSIGPLIPDQIVYAGSMPALLPLNADENEVAVAVSQFRTVHGHPPTIAVVPGMAVFAVGDTDQSARNALDTFRDALRVARDADRIGRVRVMNDRERRFIENWEAEAYRRSVAAAT